MIRAGDQNYTKVLIVGAGIAGLTAARFLADYTNYEITVLEANYRLGGRIWSYKVPGFPDQAVDVGAMWLHGGSSTEHPIRLLADLYKVKTREHDFVKKSNQEVYDLDGHICSKDEKTLLASAAMILNGTFDTTHDDSAGKDQSFEDAFRNADDTVKSLLEVPIVKFAGLPGFESYHGATREKVSVKFCDGIPDDPNRLVFDGAEDLVANQGYYAILEGLLSNARRKFQILLDRRVESIDYSQRKDVGQSYYKVKVDAVNHLGHGSSYTADFVIVSVPLGILKANHIIFNPPLDFDHRQAIRLLGFGNFVKVLLVFDKTFWPENIPFLCTQTKDPTGFPVALVNMYTVNKLPALLAIINSEGANEADKMTEDEIIRKVLRRLAVIFGDETLRQRRIVHSRVFLWSKYPLSLGAYSFAQIGMRKEDAYNIRLSIAGTIFFAGEHTSMPEAQHGTVLGAYISGLRAAKEVLTEKRVETRGLKAPHEMLTTKRLPSKL